MQIKDIRVELSHHANKTRLGIKWGGSRWAKKQKGQSQLRSGFPVHDRSSTNTHLMSEGGKECLSEWMEVRLANIVAVIAGQCFLHLVTSYKHKIGGKCKAVTSSGCPLLSLELFLRVSLHQHSLFPRLCLFGVCLFWILVEALSLGSRNAWIRHV